MSAPPAAPEAMTVVAPLCLVVDTATPTALAEETGLSLCALDTFIASVKHDGTFLSTLPPAATPTTGSWESINGLFKALDDTASHAEVFRFFDNWRSVCEKMQECHSNGYFFAVFKFRVGSDAAREQLRLFLDTFVAKRTYGNEPFVYTATEEDAEAAYRHCLELRGVVERYHGGD